VNDPQLTADAVYTLSNFSPRGLFLDIYDESYVAWRCILYRKQ